MNIDFKTWLITEKGLTRQTASTRASNVRTIEMHYGSIDALIKNGRVYNLLEDLSYSKEDERNNLQPAHIIPIHGTKKDSISNGTATLKQALKLYIQYSESIHTHCPFIKAEKKTTITPIIDINTIFDNLKKLLSKFRLSNAKATYADNRNEVRDYIQRPLLWKLQQSMPSIEWKMEYEMSPEVKDRCDIYGKVNDNTAVIIEIDTYRSDQVCKKYVSRQALNADMNIIYIVITYPNNNSNSLAYKNEFDKYKRYLYNLTTMIEAGSGLKKYLYIHDL